VKKVKDYYYKKAKKDNYPARSVYKLEEAQKKHQLLKKNDRVLDLGCYPGSWTLYAAKVVGPKGLVVGADLQKGKPLSVKGGAEIYTFAGDIYDQEIVARLLDVSATYNVVVSDMAPKTTGNRFSDQQKSLDLARQAFQLATDLLVKGGNFYCKVFEGEDFKEYVDTVRRAFSKTKIIKPKSSRAESREVFVLGIHFLDNG